MIRRNQISSTSAMCRTMPSSDSDDGSTDRRARPSGSSPEHFSSSVPRCQPRNPVSVASSEPAVGGSIRGSFSGSMKLSIGMPDIIRAGRGIS